MKKNILIQAILELNNWELLYVFEELSKSLLEEMPTQNVTVDEYTIDAMRAILVHIAEEQVIELNLLEKFVSEAESKANVGQVEVTYYLVTVAISLFLKKLAKHLNSKKEINVLNQILDELVEEEDADENVNQ